MRASAGHGDGDAADEQTQHAWSLKGITPEARDAARAAAQREGMTIGAWLERTIRTAAAREAGLAPDAATAAPEAAEPEPSSTPAAAPAEPAGSDEKPTDADTVEAALARLERHLNASEERATAAVAPLQQRVGSLLNRLEAVERDLSEDRRDSRK